MLSVIIKNNGEDNVVKLTYENLWKELKDIPDTELYVAEDWFDYLSKVKSRYICFVEADCLVSSGYFASQLGLIKKNPMMRKIAVMGSSTAVNDWANKFYGYQLGNNFADGIIPSKEKKSNQVYAAQIAYIPGSLVHTDMLKKLLYKSEFTNNWQNDLVYFSTQLSLGFWRGGIGSSSHSYSGNRVHLNPNATYVTTEDYVNDIGKFDAEAGDLINMFHREGI